MKVGILGGLLVGGLVAWALLGAVSGIILLAVGAAASCVAAGMERQAERRATSWRYKYPTYKY